MAAYMRQRYKDNIAWIREHKVEKGCADCGYNEHHAGLEFDHLIPRNGNDALRISKLAGSSLNRIKKEIAKCEVVCGTCHNIRTWNRRQEEAIPYSSEAEHLTLNQGAGISKFPGGTDKGEAMRLAEHELVVHLDRPRDGSWNHLGDDEIISKVELEIRQLDCVATVIVREK